MELATCHPSGALNSDKFLFFFRKNVYSPNDEYTYGNQNNNNNNNNYIRYLLISGPGSSVGIATDYGLDGPGSNPGGNEIFRPSRPALGPTQPPIQWVPGLPQG